MQIPKEEMYKKALHLAARETIFAPPEKLEELAFPVWQKAIHEVLVFNGCCQCLYQDAKCLLDLSKENQISLHSGGELSFEDFLEVLMETRNLFMAEAMSVSAYA